MSLICGLALVVGFVHSLAPGHWLPVVFLVRSRKWGGQQAFFAAVVAATGHVVSSVILGAMVFVAGDRVFGISWHELEGYSGYFLAGFGIIYSVFSFRKHRSCHGHEHHGPTYRKGVNPYLFLFTIGLAPCFAVLPVFFAANAYGQMVLSASMVCFSLGVLGAFLSGSYLSSKGHLKLDHPLFEHYGDVLTGAAVFLSGVLLVILPEVFHFHSANDWLNKNGVKTHKTEVHHEHAGEGERQ